MSAERLPNLLGAAAVALADRVGEVSVEVAGIAGEAPAALVTVGTRPGRSIEHLRRSLGLSHSGTVRLVDRLEDRGWVRRRRSGTRTVRLELTSRGKRVFLKLLDARRAVLESALEPLAPGDRTSLEGLLETLLAGLPESRDDARRICRLCEHALCRGRDCPVGAAVS